MCSALSSSSSASETINSSLNDTAASTVNVDPSEVEKFNNLAGEWWSNTGAFATLHEINPLRLNWIEDEEDKAEHIAFFLDGHYRYYHIKHKIMCLILA